MIAPVFGDDPAGVFARVVAINPADLLFSESIGPGRPAMFVGYGGRDNWNFDARSPSRSSGSRSSVASRVDSETAMRAAGGTLLLFPPRRGRGAPVAGGAHPAAGRRDAPTLGVDLLARGPGRGAMLEAEGEQLAPAIDGKVPIEVLDIIMDRVAAQAEAGGDLLLAVAFDQGLERLLEPLRQALEDAPPAPGLLAVPNERASSWWSMCISRPSRMVNGPSPSARFRVKP